MKHGSILYLSDQQVAQLLSFEDVPGIAEQVFRETGQGKVLFAEESFLPAEPTGANRFMANPVCFPQKGLLGVKWIGMYAHPQPGHASIQGELLILNDAATALPAAIMGATALTALRTAGGHAAVAAKYLCIPQPDALAVIGGGAQGTYGTLALLRLFPSLKEVRVFSPLPAFLHAMADCPPVSLQVCETAEEAIQGTQLVLMASASQDILVKASWILPGTTVLAINAFRDLDPLMAGRADKWVLGEWVRDIKNIVKNPALTHGADLSGCCIYADMCDIVCGRKVGRENSQEIIVYTHMGMGAFDVACGQVAYARARAQGIGIMLPR